MDAVGAADADGADVFAGALAEHLDELARAGQDDLAGRAQLEACRRVEDVARRQAEVDPAAGVSGRLAQDVDERRDVVVGRALALVDGLDGERRRSDGVELLLGRALHGLARRDLHAAPRLHPRLVGPQGAHVRAGVARDHLASSSPDMSTGP